MRSIVLLAAAAACCVVAPASQAGVATKLLEVTATVDSFCSVVSASGVGFGSYTTQNVSGGLPLDVNTFISVICPDGTPYTIGLDNGLHGMVSSCDMGTPINRNMESVNVFGGNLAYDLYSNEYLTVWGCSPESVVSSVGTNTIQEFPLYGRIQPGIITPADDYADTVTIIVTF